MIRNVCTRRLVNICVALLLEEGAGEGREQFAANGIGTVKAKNSLRGRRRGWRETCSRRWGGWRWKGPGQVSVSRGLEPL
jgi:hypothetical protein